MSILVTVFATAGGAQAFTHGAATAFAVGAGMLALALVLHYHHKHHNWVRCRLAAEFCRSALATWGLPRTAPLFEDLNLPAVRGLARSGVMIVAQ